MVGRAGEIEEDAVERRPITGELPLLAELRAFVEHLQGGPPPRSSAADAIAIVERVAAMIDLATAEEAASL